MILAARVERSQIEGSQMLMEEELGLLFIGEGDPSPLEG